jgi:hypothetical protein
MWAANVAELTAYNRTVYATPAVAPLVFRSLWPRCARQLRWRTFPRSLQTHFCGCCKPTVSLIATAKTSYTAETLCAIGLKFIVKK